MAESWLNIKKVNDDFSMKEAELTMINGHFPQIYMCWSGMQTLVFEVCLQLSVLTSSLWLLCSRRSSHLLDLKMNLIPAAIKFYSNRVWKSKWENKGDWVAQSWQPLSFNGKQIFWQVYSVICVAPADDASFLHLTVGICLLPATWKISEK